MNNNKEELLMHNIKHDEIKCEKRINSSYSCIDA